MIKVGLTGGIGTGKSTISKMLIQAGFPLIDADKISREVLEKYPQILEEVRRTFGEVFFDWRGEFRRKEFGSHIFRFPKQKRKYEEIIIPFIIKEIKEQFDKIEKSGGKIGILDAPTLIENNLHLDMDYVIVVWADKNNQLQRVKSRDKLGNYDAMARINSQMSLDQKIELANIVIDNNSTIEVAERQIADLCEFFNKVIKEGA